MKVKTGIEEDDGEIQHTKQTDACVAVETKDVAKTHYVWMFQC